MTTMIIQYLLIAISISLVTTAIHVMTWTGMLFSDIADSVENKILTFCHNICAKMRYVHCVDKTICKPLFRCLICMSSFWGLMAWAVLRFYYGYYFNPVLLILLVCGINTLITSVISNLLPDGEQKNSLHKSHLISSVLLDYLSLQVDKTGCIQSSEREGYPKGKRVEYTLGQDILCCAKWDEFFCRGQGLFQA